MNDDMAADIIVALKGEVGLTDTNLAKVRAILSGTPPVGLDAPARIEWVRTRMAGLDVKAFHAVLKAQGGCACSYAGARRYHAGERKAPVDYLVAVSRAYGVSLWWLATGEEAQ